MLLATVGTYKELCTRFRKVKKIGIVEVLYTLIDEVQKDVDLLI